MERLTHRNMARALLLGVALQASVAAGKSPPNLTPALDSPAYWDSHVILHGEVIGHDGADVPIQILDQFSGDTPAPAMLTLKQNDMWLEPHGDPLVPAVTPNGYDHVLIVSSMSPVVVYVPGNERAAALTESCRLIQKIRQGADLTAELTRATKAADPVAERYVLNALLARTGKGLDEKVTTLVASLRADGSAELQTRMLASDLLQAALLAKGTTKDDWEWIAGVLRKETNLDAESFRTLTERMLTQDGEQRARTIDLICELATDTEGPARRRAYVICAGDLDRLIDGAVPRDPGNVKMMELCIGRMTDPSPAVRASAAGALWRFGNRLAASKGPRAEWMPMLTQAVTAIHTAQTQESAKDMQIWLKDYQERLEQMLAPPAAQ